MQVERVYGTYLDSTYSIPLNKIGNRESIRCPNYKTLVLPDNKDTAPWLKETTEIKVHFRADHPPIKSYLANSSPEQTEIHLPSTHLEALVYYIASRATNANGISGEFHDGNNYAGKFEAAVAKLKQLNFDVDVELEDTKLLDRGFV